MVEFRVLVCGGRHYDNRERLFRVLDKALQAGTLAGRIFTLVHGGARGADSLSHEWAATRQIGDVRVYEADWKTHGRAAGPIRNKKMLTESQGELLDYSEWKNLCELCNEYLTLKGLMEELIATYYMIKDEQ